MGTALPSLEKKRRDQMPTAEELRDLAKHYRDLASQVAQVDLHNDYLDLAAICERETEAIERESEDIQQSS
jgi:hypothetical protein